MRRTAPVSLVALCVGMTACGGSTQTFDALTVTTSALEGGLLEVAYVQQLRATGGDGNYSWSLVSGSIPAGLDLNGAGGRIQGVPTTVGSWTFTLLVSSGDGQSAEREMSIEVTYRPLAFTTTTLPPAVQEMPYASALAADGGDGSYTFAVISGSLPDGLQMSSAGELSGTPSTVEGASFEIAVQSGDGQSTVQEFEISVHVPLALTTTTLPEGTQGVAYEAFLAATGGDGTYLWSVSGALPTGLTLQTTAGRIWGTPASSQTANFTVTVSSGDGQSAQRDLDLAIEKLFLLPSERCSENPSTAVGTFEDAALEAAVRAQLGVAAGVDLTCALLADPTALSAGSASIGSLAGIQNLRGLRLLYLAFNSISDLTYVGELPSLEGLNVNNNLISDLGPLGGIVTLSLLHAVDNSITDLGPLAALTAMEHLKVDENSITDISAVEGMVRMRILEMHSNTISDVSAVSGMAELQTLNLDNNDVTDVSALTALDGLMRLDLGANSVADVSPLAALEALTFLHLGSNSIANISPLSGLTSLTELFLDRNQITDVGALAGMSELATLWLSSNPGLADIQPLLDNPGLGAGDGVALNGTNVSCADIAALAAGGATVYSDCP